MIVKRIGIIGLGTVGEAVAVSLRKYSSLISRRHPFKLQVKKVCDLRKSKSRIAKKLGCLFTTDYLEIVNDPSIDIVVELIGGIKPAYELIIKALKNKKGVVTANKALLAAKGKEILSVSESTDMRIGFEAAVCGAIPLVKAVSEGLAGCEVSKIYGILNGTTNYILDKMDKEKLDFSEALKQAQSKGLAEKQPKLDIDGIDTLHKLCILSYLCYGVWPVFDKVYTEGISKISLADVLYAKELNYRIKLLAIAKKAKGALDLRVHPALISIEHPLAQVSGAYNAVYLDTKPAGELLFYGEGAGGVPTSSAVMSDIVSIAYNDEAFIRKQEAASLFKTKNANSRYYIRFMAQDSPGVLAKISKVLSSLKVGIASVTQKERKKGKLVPIIMLTHQASADNINKAVAAIDRLRVIKSPSQIIRIEDL